MSKKIVNISLFCGLLLWLTGCIKEDRSDCTDYSYLLSFIYYGNGTTDIFDSKVENVYLYVYNLQGDPETTDPLILSKPELNAFQGVMPDLSPGNYEVVCWANVTGLSEITGNGSEQPEDRLLYSRPYLADETITNFDSLYYGSQIITVPDRRDGRDTVFFRSAHIHIDVYIDGLSTTAEEDSRAVGDPEGWLEVRNVYVGYDFRMQQTGEIAPMYPDAVTDPATGILTSRFDLFRFENENRIYMDVYNGNGRRVYSLSLADFMRENNIRVEGVNEVDIPIYIRFNGVNVHLSITEWDSEIVAPVV